MNFFDYIWIIKLVIEILKLIAALSPDERISIHDLHSEIGDFVNIDGASTKKKRQV